MNGQSNQPDETIKVPEARVETKGTDTAGTITGGVGEVVTNATQAGRNIIAALLADTVDNGTNGTSVD